MANYETNPEEPIAAQAPKKTTRGGVVVGVGLLLAGMTGAAIKLSGGTTTAISMAWLNEDEVCEDGGYDCTHRESHAGEKCCPVGKCRKGEVDCSSIHYSYVGERCCPVGWAKAKACDRACAMYYPRVWNQD